MARISLFVMLLSSVLLCTSCKPSLTSKYYSFPGTNGCQYACEVIDPRASTLFIHPEPLTVVISRVGGGLKEYPLQWRIKNDQVFVDNKPLVIDGNLPTIVFKEDGRVQYREISHSPIWAVFFTGNRPTDQELERVFEALDQPK